MKRMGEEDESSRLNKNGKKDEQSRQSTEEEEVKKKRKQRRRERIPCRREGQSARLSRWKQSKQQATRVSFFGLGGFVREGSPS